LSSALQLRDYRIWFCEAGSEADQVSVEDRQYGDLIKEKDHERTVESEVDQFHNLALFRMTRTIVAMFFDCEGKLGFEIGDVIRKTTNNTTQLLEIWRIVKSGSGDRS
jgi:hypothetical protein